MMTQSQSTDVKNLLKKLTRKEVTIENLQILEVYLDNIQFDSLWWQTMFDSQGASDALEQGFYSPDMVRLLTLQAVVLPETLPHFLDWLKTRDKQDSSYQTCLDFQVGIRNSLQTLPTVEKKIITGVRLIIPQLLEHPNRLEILAWLLKAENGCWGELYRKSLRQDLDDTLKNYPEKIAFSDSDRWEIILGKLIVKLCFKEGSFTQNYSIFGDLFYLLGDYQISAIFYHVSMGKIPKKAFRKLNSENHEFSEIEVYNTKVKCDLNILDYIFLTLASIIFLLIIAFKFLFYLICGIFGLFLTFAFIGFAFNHWPILLLLFFMFSIFGGS